MQRTLFESRLVLQKRVPAFASPNDFLAFAKPFWTSTAFASPTSDAAWPNRSSEAEFHRNSSFPTKTTTLQSGEPRPREPRPQPQLPLKDRKRIPLLQERITMVIAEALVSQDSSLCYVMKLITRLNVLDRENVALPRGLKAVTTKDHRPGHPRSNVLEFVFHNSCPMCVKW